MKSAGIYGTHWVRYGTAADQCYLEGEFRATYDQIVVNGNMVAHMPSALSVFLTQRVQKPFVIDPQTHAFAHDIEYLLSKSKSSAGEIKRSWRKLIEKYGEVLEHALLEEKRPLDPTDFDNEVSRKNFTKNVLLFQRDAITDEIKEGPDRDYVEFLKEETGTSTTVMPPAMLVAPYFFIHGPLAAGWQEKNLQFIQDSRSVVTAEGIEEPLAAQLVISQEILADSRRRDELVELYAQQEPDVILLWIDQLNEHTAPESELESFISLLSGFAKKKIPVVNLYGGFFSVAMMRFSTLLNGQFAAVCHGLEYGETRSVIPLGGGTPVAKFYSRQLHHRLPPRVALRTIHLLDGMNAVSDFHSNVCGCRNCQEVICEDPEQDLIAYFETKESTFWRAGKRISMDFPTGQASENCTKHYMWCKEWEYRDMATTIDQLKQELLKTDQQLRKPIGVEYAGHPLAWSNVLR